LSLTKKKLLTDRTSGETSREKREREPDERSARRMGYVLVAVGLLLMLLTAEDALTGF
jgi:hypothetical protein